MADSVETTHAPGTFSTLLPAVQTAGLTETLKDAGSFTVFALTDDAFMGLPVGTVDGLLKDTQRLKDILTYQCHAGERFTC